MFSTPEKKAPGLPVAAITVAALVVVVLLGFLLVFGRRHGGPAAAAAGTVNAAYAPQLVLSDVQMSESTSFSGGKETFVDGRIINRGSSTVVGATVEVSFPADGGVAPQTETVPMMLIRTRQPYIDTEPLSAEPLTPGAGGEFRLTFDDVRPDWNQAVPALRVTAVTLK